MAWTREQQQAIETVGTNLLISAGAGSGKTAVLTARVLSHLHQGIHIHELLILTFTKAAAGEMKERIRNSIKKEESLQSELETLDEAYITTFDSFSLSIVKKYHYLLNLPKNPKITDETMIQILRKQCMRDVFDSFYEEEDPSFLHFIDTFCVKEDEALLKELLNVSKKLEDKRDLFSYLEHYERNFYQEEFVDFCFSEYEKMVLEKREELRMQIEEFSYVAPKEYFEKLELAFDSFFQANTYDELYLLKSVRMPVLPRGSEEELKFAKEKVQEKLKELKQYFNYGTRFEMKQEYLQTKDFVHVICQIFLRYFTRFEAEKKNKGYFDFHTIAHYALTLLENEPTVLKEMKSQFKEIMVDEYQDTNDLQEAFLHLLGENNIYMVGDIKQSIYRFRDANPYLFKKKYEDYAKNHGGQKIDLLKNFRSRKEVLQNINLLFNPLMDDFLGGANYQQDHQMVFGNLSYEEEKNLAQNYDMEFYTYPVIKNSTYSKEEIEIFFVAQDIKKKIQNQEQVYDKKTGKLRPITYGDFCILMDRTSSFNLYRSIFNFFELPLTLYKDEVLSSNIHFMMIKNCFLLLSKLKHRVFDEEFRFAFASLARGFLFQISDELLYQTMTNKTWNQVPFFHCFESILKGIDGKNLLEIFHELLDVTHYYEKLILIGNVEEGMFVLEKLEQLVQNASEFGYTYEDFIVYLEQILEDELELKYSPIKEDLDSVKIMTIHKSKGLEFPVCYFTGLYKKFNIRDLKESFLWDKNYGLISPFSSEGLMDSFVKDLVKNQFLIEEISEKIRLFYVSLTRVREKMIFVLPASFSEPILKQEGIISNLIRLKYRSFADFLYSLFPYLQKYIHSISLESLELSKDYLIWKEKEELNLESSKISVSSYEMKKDLLEETTFSKSLHTLITQKENKNLVFGTSIHQTLQYFDFKHPSFEAIPDLFVRQKIEVLWNQDFIQQHLDGEFYQEYEFFDSDGTTNFHGVIDLLILLPDKAMIVDYKLKNISDSAYEKQLNGYKTYIEKEFGVKTELVLYSLLDSTFTFLSR